MPIEVLVSTMETHDMRVKDVASLIHVSCRRVYRWLDGTLDMPEREIEYLTLKLKSLKEEASKPRQALRLW